MNRELIVVQPNGLIQLPDWAWKALLKKAGVRSKRYRVQKRVVKRLFMELLVAEMKKR